MWYTGLVSKRLFSARKNASTIQSSLYLSATSLGQKRSDNHLLVVASAILGAPKLPERLSTPALEVDAGGVEEYQRKLREQILISREQAIFDAVLDPSQLGDSLKVQAIDSEVIQKVQQGLAPLEP